MSNHNHLQDNPFIHTETRIVMHSIKVRKAMLTANTKHPKQHYKEMCIPEHEKIPIPPIPLCGCRGLGWA